MKKKNSGGIQWEKKKNMCIYSTKQPFVRSTMPLCEPSYDISPTDGSDRLGYRWPFFSTISSQRKSSNVIQYFFSHGFSTDFAAHLPFLISVTANLLVVYS